MRSRLDSFYGISCSTPFIIEVSSQRTCDRWAEKSHPSTVQRQIVEAASYRHNLRLPPPASRLPLPASRFPLQDSDASTGSFAPMIRTQSMNATSPSLKG